MKRLLLLGVLLSLCGVAQAQFIKFNPQTTTGAGSITPVLTWCTELTQTSGATCGAGPATTCTASGSWSGTKAAAGTETLPVITASATYNLVCTWASDDSTTLTWIVPTKNTDGSNYVDPLNIKIYSGTNQATLLQQTPRIITPPTATTAVISPLTPGTWFFTLRFVNLNGVESEQSNVVQKVITAAPAAQRNVSLTVNTKPGTTTTLAAQ